MALRVKNIEAGYWKKIRVGRKVISKFFPIRSSSDYDTSRAHTSTGETEAERKKRTMKKALKKVKPSQRKAATKLAAHARKSAKKAGIAYYSTSGKLIKPKAKKAAKKATKKTATKKKAVKRSKNPIPVNFTDAKVRRLPSGDIQVMILK